MNQKSLTYGPLFLCFVTVLCTSLSSFSADLATNQLPAPVTSLPLGLPTPVLKEKTNPKQIEFGQFLFFSPLLSLDHSINCSNCHVPSLAFSGPTPVAAGVFKRTGRRHAPPLFNLYNMQRFMWDGRAAGLKEQIHIPLESSFEMGIDWPHALAKLKTDSEAQKFRSMNSRSSEFNKQIVTSALAAYVKSLVSGESPFDRYFYGGEKDAISQDAKDGLKIFMYKAQCSTCHLLTGTSALLNDNGFHSIGIGYNGSVYKDNGRYEVTKRDEDLGRFKTPTLRNVSQRKFYMHDGSMSSLREVIDYYNRGGNKGAPNMDTRIQQLYLSDKEIIQLIAFLETLSSPIESLKPHHK